MGDAPFVFCARSPLCHVLDDKLLAAMQNQPPRLAGQPDVEITRSAMPGPGKINAGGVITFSEAELEACIRDALGVAAMSDSELHAISDADTLMCELEQGTLNKAGLCEAFCTHANGQDADHFFLQHSITPVIQHLWENMSAMGCVVSSEEGEKYCAVPGDVYRFGMRLFRPESCGWQRQSSLLIGYTVNLSPPVEPYSSAYSS